jgi:hypothetical protein
VTDTTWIVALVGALIGGGGFGAWIKAYLDSRVKLRALDVEAESKEREDTGRLLLEAMQVGSSSKAQAQLAVWVREERERYDACRREQADLRNLLVEAQSEVRELRTTVRRLERQAALRDAELQRLRDMLLQDYARKTPSVPAGPPDAEIRPLRTVGKDGE